MKSHSVKLLRLKQGTRYVVAIAHHDGTVCSTLFWSEPQALVFGGVPQSAWSSVAIEVYKAILVENLPQGAVVFAKESRKGRFLGGVVWGRQGLFPRIVPSLAEALIACRPPAGVRSTLG